MYQFNEYIAQNKEQSIKLRHSMQGKLGVGVGGFKLTIKKEKRNKNKWKMENGKKQQLL